MILGMAAVPSQGALSTCMAAAERMLVAWAGRADGYATRATPVTSAQVWKAWVRVARYWVAAKVEEVVNPAVGGEQTLRLAG